MSKAMNLVLAFWNLPLSVRRELPKELGLLDDREIACMNEPERYTLMFQRVKERGMIRLFTTRVMRAAHQYAYPDPRR